VLPIPQNGLPPGGPPARIGNVQGGGPGSPGGPGGLGGLLDTRTPSAALVKLLKDNASTYTWVAATVGANSGAGVQLATGLPVMAIGGFNGTDPSPTLEAFKDIVASGKVHYFLSGGRGGPGGPGGFRGPGGGASGTSNQISTWVQETFSSKTVGGVTVYDLTDAAPNTASSV
jgi:hypothetical protein